MESLLELTPSEPCFGVINIETDSLVPLPAERVSRAYFEPYAAVRYVWCDTSNMDYRTNIENIQSRRKSGGLAATIRKLPKALAQSIQLVHDLGIKTQMVDGCLFDVHA